MQPNNVSCEKMKFSQLAALHLLRSQANDFAIGIRKAAIDECQNLEAFFELKNWRVPQGYRRCVS